MIVREDVSDEDEPETIEELVPPRFPSASALTRSVDMSELELPPFVPSPRRRFILLATALFALSFALSLGIGTSVYSSPSAPHPAPTAGFR